MEKKPFESKSKLSLDRILSEIAELESSQGEPERIWSLGDINALLESTASGSNTEQHEDDSPAEDILGSLDYLEDRYTNLPDDEQESAAEVPADEHPEESPVTDADTADFEQEEIEPDVAESAPEVSEDDNAEEELSEPDSEPEIVSGEEEIPEAEEDVPDDTYEPEPQEEASESATESTDNSDDEEIVTISLTPLHAPEENRAGHWHARIRSSPHRKRRDHGSASPDCPPGTTAFWHICKTIRFPNAGSRSIPDDRIHCP